MKDLRIPVPSAESVDLSEITPDFRGIIIGYKGDNATGYIQHWDGSWYFIDYIDMESERDSDSSLLDLITCLIKSNICSHFKVIEFAQRWP